MSTTQARKQFVSERPFTRRDFLSTSLKAGTAAFTTGLLPKRKTNAQGQYNVLFIIVDDLRPLSGYYGYPEIHTPNIDRLAQHGMVFNRAYCQYPVCNPSRASMLTGLRPETVGVLDNFADFRETVPEAVTLPQHFKAHGYHSLSIGKITHGAMALRDTRSWSAPIWRPRWQPYIDTPSWQALNVEDDKLRDGQVVKRTIKVLEEVRDLQFFLAVGFYKPHMPFKAPAKYYELYDSPIIDNVPRVMPHSNHEVRSYSDIPSGDVPLSEEKTLELIRGYAASTSYMDAQVGRVLDRLDSLGLTENTIIVLCGDHGFHLGEHETWGKRTTYEVALRTSLIVSIPGQKHLGGKTDALVELVDIFPTLCEACQLPIPSQLEGISMVPIINNPIASWKSAVFSKVGRENGKRSMRTEQYRYTESGKNGWLGKELYDHQTDPGETINIVHLPENSELVVQLSERLHAGWRAALPDTQQRTSVRQTLPWDINNDGVVDIQDLLLISNSFGAEDPTYPKVDVNKDGKVDIIDLLLVASHFGESINRAALSPLATISTAHFDLIEQWLTEARLAHDGSSIFREGIAVLEALIDSGLPTETALLPNYPNPFNPETWIPYDLAADSDVEIHIYNLKGESVRQLSLGFQNAGPYRTRSRAAYWDGRNAVGEPVASGVYFYTLHAGQIKATRQMVIFK